MPWKYGTPIRIKTPNYDLVSVRKDMVTDELVGWYADPEVMRYVSETFAMTKEQLIKGFAQHDNRTSFALLIVDRKKSKPIGIFRIQRELRDKAATTSVLIGNKDYWGKNAVYEIREVIFRFLFEYLDTNKIVGAVRARNFPAQFNYMKQGFTQEGLRRKHVMSHDGEFEDMIEYGLLKEDWIKRQQELKAQKK